MAKIKRKFTPKGFHYEAVELRYLGYTYPEIAEHMQKKYDKITERTVNNWFKRDGLLEKMYFDYAYKENERRRNVIRVELNKLAVKVPQILQELLERPERFFGKTVRDDEGKIVRKLDSNTIKALKLIMEAIGFQTTIDEADPLDEYFDRQEQLLAASDGKIPDSTDKG